MGLFQQKYKHFRRWSAMNQIDKKILDKDRLRDSNCVGERGREKNEVQRMAKIIF